MAKKVTDYDTVTRQEGANSLLNALLGYTADTKKGVSDAQRKAVAIALLGYNPEK